MRLPLRRARRTPEHTAGSTQTGTSMEANQRSKKNLLIMRGYQGRMISLILLVGFVCTVFTGYIYYAYVKGSYDFILPYTTLPADLVAQRYNDLLVFGVALGIA